MAIEAVSAIGATVLVRLTLKPCKASGVPYLLGIPAGFGLLAVSFAVMSVETIAGSASQGGVLLQVVSLLTQTYGLLFLALIYTRRMRLRFIGESTSIELAVPSLITLGVLSYAFVTPISFLIGMNLSLRIVMALCAIYLTYEAERSWSLTRRASDGFVIFGFALMFLEQFGFILNAQNPGDVALFISYEGRILSLLILIAIVSVGVRKDDLRTGLKRLGLTAPAHLQPVIEANT
jgi:hypothetical protein